MIFAPKLWDWVDKDSKHDYIILAAGVLLAILFLLYITLKSYPADYADGVLIVDSAKMVRDGYKDAGRFFGLTLGWFLERRLVRFSLDVPVHHKIMRCCVGILLLILLESALIPAVAGLLGSGPGYFIMMAAELIVLTAAYPWCFQKYELHTSKNQSAKKRVV